MVSVSEVFKSQNGLELKWNIQLKILLDLLDTLNILTLLDAIWRGFGSCSEKT
jgi:hypothetical protein